VPVLFEAAILYRSCSITVVVEHYKEYRFYSRPQQSKKAFKYYFHLKTPSIYRSNPDVSISTPTTKMTAAFALDDKTEKVGITLPIALVKQTDKARGDIPRSTFIRRAVEQYIRGKGGK
jgi:hypothetical protein